MRVGYACINNTLAAEGIHVNRSMVKRTFLQKGISFASELALQNVTDLEKVIDWNISQGLKLYRLSSDMFPWMSEYELESLPDFDAISTKLAEVGRKVMANGHRLTFHPGPFNVLAAEDPRILSNTLKELRQHGEIMDLLGMPPSPFAKINIHIGGAYGNRKAALLRFIQNFKRLHMSAAARLTVENDDKASMFSVGDLLEVHAETGVPIVFDFHHHRFRHGDLTTDEAFFLALETWPKMVRPVIHYSSSKRVFEDSRYPEASHADFVYERLDCYGQHVDIMLEAKAKELATLKFIKDFPIEAPLPDLS